MIHHRVSLMSAHLIVICSPESRAAFICNEPVLECWIFIWYICATELWMSQTPWRPGHGGIAAEASPPEGGRGGTSAIICSLRGVWAPRLCTIYQQINLSRLTSFIDCWVDKEEVDCIRMRVGEERWMKRVEALVRETDISGSDSSARVGETCRKRLRGNWHERSWQPAISCTV